MISTELLTKLFRATPEQLAAVEQILAVDEWRGAGGEAMAGDGSGQVEVMAALLRIERKVDGLVAAAQLPTKKEPLEEGECLRVFRLFGFFTLE